MRYGSVRYGYRKLRRAECARVAKVRRRINRMMADLDGLPIEPVKGRRISADLDALDYRLYEVERQLCGRKR